MADAKPEVTYFPTMRKSILVDGRRAQGEVDKTTAEYLEQQDTSKFEYVDIPAEDIFNKPHRSLSINGVRLERGHRYFVAPSYAKEIRDRLAIAQKADMRILQSNPDQPKPRMDNGQWPTDANLIR